MIVADFLKKSVDLLAEDIRNRAKTSVSRLRSAYDDEERILQDALASKLAQDEDAAKKCELEPKASHARWMLDHRAIVNVFMFCIIHQSPAPYFCTHPQQAKRSFRFTLQ